MAKPTGRPFQFPITPLQAINVEAGAAKAPPKAPRSGDPEALVLTANAVLALDANLARIFNSTGIDDDELKHERAQYVHALKAMADFFKQIGIKDYDRRFYRLALAIDDLNRGAVEPLLAARQEREIK